jgi:hypothetical protein
MSSTQTSLSSCERCSWTRAKQRKAWLWPVVLIRIHAFQNYKVGPVLAHHHGYVFLEHVQDVLSSCRRANAHSRHPVA